MRDQSVTASETLQTALHPSRRVLLRRLFRNRSTTIGLFLSLVYVVIFVLGTLALTPYPPTEQHPKKIDRLQAPGAIYLLGSDQFGRDELSRIIRGSIYSLRASVVSVTIAALLGGTIGTLSGYIGGWFDVAAMRAVDIFFAFPSILLALAVVSALGPGANNVIPALVFVYTPIFARVSRAPVLTVKALDYITAARCLGVPNWRIVRFHILPNTLSPLMVTVSLALSWALLTEAGLSFLGLGPQPPEPSWGLMLKEGRNFIETAPWLSIFPGLAILFAVLGFNLLGDGLQEWLDPHQRH